MSGNGGACPERSRGAATLDEAERGFSTAPYVTPAKPNPRASNWVSPVIPAFAGMTIKNHRSSFVNSQGASGARLERAEGKPFSRGSEHGPSIRRLRRLLRVRPVWRLLRVRKKIVAAARDGGNAPALETVGADLGVRPIVVSRVFASARESTRVLPYATTPSVRRAVPPRLGRKISIRRIADAGEFGDPSMSGLW